MKTCNDAPVGYTDHPPVGQWQPWTGGICPVHPLCVVEYVMRAEQSGPDAADQLDWEHSGDSWDIVAYRIVEEYKQPREIWARIDRKGFVSLCLPTETNAVKFMEVTQ